MSPYGFLKFSSNLSDYVQRTPPEEDACNDRYNSELSKYTSFKEQLARDVAILSGGANVGALFTRQPPDHCEFFCRVFPAASPEPA